jgi:hypothetical protein
MGVTATVEDELWPARDAVVLFIHIPHQGCRNSTPA